MTTIRKLASSGAALAVLSVLILTGCPDTGGDDAVCGNDVVEQGESCDDGNTFDGDGCSATCSFEGFCGNSILEPGEECDDGNYNPGDGCDADCSVEEGCGNGILEVGEGCDDDNLISGDGCSGTCVDEEAGAVCGNGVWEPMEGCDDGNTEDGDGCSATCAREDGCGDGEVVFPEQCDDGNNVSGDGCMYDCRLEFVVDDGTCDEANNETCEYSPADCCPDCGNGVLDPGEGCDDGNNVSLDGCSQGCTDEVPGAECGNAIVEPTETCDDGNTEPADGCDGSCQAEFTPNDGTCDTANHETCDNSPADCCPNCNGGTMDPGEQCDGSDFGGIVCEDFCYEGGTLSCTIGCQIDTSTCTGTLPTCGDNTAGCDEECDGTDLRSQTCESLGFESGTPACGSGCTFDTSGCVNRLWYLNEGFESGLPTNWSTHGMWEVGTPSSVGPAAAHDGANCAGTVIDNVYLNDGTYAFDWLETPLVDLTGATVPVLLFYAWLNSESQIDGGNVRISSDGGASFVTIPTTNVQPAYDHDSVGGEGAWTGAFANAGWRPVVVNLAPWAGQQVLLRFAFHSDSATNDAGWYVDDVFIAEAPDIPVQITNNDPLPTAVTGYPYDQQMSVLGGSGGYAWSIEGGTNHSWLGIDPSTGLLTGTPLATHVGAVSVIIRVEDTANASNFDEQTFHLDVLNAIWFEDFEGTAAPTGWTGVGGTLPTFEWGSPSAVGPATCNGGSGCIGTALAGTFDPLMSFCMAAGTCVAVTPDIDLAGTTAPVLTFWQWVEFGSPTDGGALRVTDTIAAQTYDVVPVPAYNGTAGGMMGMGGEPAYSGDMSGSGWQLVTVDLSAYAGTTITITFDILSDITASLPGPGWYLDDMMIAD